MLTQGALAMFHQMTLEGMTEFTFLQGSAYGTSPLIKPAGEVSKCGQVHAPASPSRLPGKATDSAMSATYGRKCTDSSKSAILSQSLANRLRVRTDILGSILYKLT